jgi:succinoglycan biosynthesis protein ExoA
MRGQAEALVVIPCLNEAAHIDAVLDQILDDPAEALRVVVVDGGSEDGTRAIVERRAAREPRLLLMDNPKRIQSAGVNHAVAKMGHEVRFLIRIDAHAAYPAGYCRTLIAEAEATGADAVVVSMRAQGEGCFQEGVAGAQNSVLGNGGSPHRSGASGRWVDHGHHALMRMDAFRAVGGYDESFTHNEDAELDLRLCRHGYRIWLTDATQMTYMPRSRPSALFRQYFRYGKGRARTILTHRLRPKLRQSVPIAVAPVAGLALLSPALPLAGLPLAMWVGLCLAFGVWSAVRGRRLCLAGSGVAALIMHLAWSLGFWALFLSWHGRRTT